MRWLDCDYNRISTMSPSVALWLSELNGCSITGNPIVDRPELAGVHASMIPRALRAVNREDAEGGVGQRLGGLERCCWQVRSILIASCGIALILNNNVG